jgi:hypothetical protein
VTEPPQLPASLELNLPPELEAGVYASFAAVWQDNDTFVLDFAVHTRPPEPVPDLESGAVTSVRVPARVVSRVRIPSGQAWDLMRALNDQLDRWEAHRSRSEPPVAGD